MTTAIRTETLDDEIVVVTAVIPTSTDRVYRAFTDPAELGRWWWPERFAATYEIDARPGGSFRVATSALPEHQSMGVHGKFLELSPTRMALSWQWEGEEEITQVAIDLEKLDEVRTQVVVTHSASPSTDARDAHGQGWHDCLTRLVDYAAA
jgi:uncharacterized protein YndB with AHSA1/START domain